MSETQKTFPQNFHRNYQLSWFQYNATIHPGVWIRQPDLSPLCQWTVGGQHHNVCCAKPLQI